MIRNQCTYRKVCLLLRIAFIVSYISSCRGKREVTCPVIKPFTEAVYAYGTVKAYNQHTIYATHAGVLKSIIAPENSIVKAGENIAEIIDETVDHKLSHAEWMLKSAQLNMNESSPALAQLDSEIASLKKKLYDDSLNYQRYKELYNKNATSRVEFEKHELAFQKSKYMLEELHMRKKERMMQLKAQYMDALNTWNLRNAEKKQHKIKSMINGKIYRWFKTEGELVKPQEAIALAGDNEKFIYELQIEEAEFSKIKVGQTVWLTLDAFGEKVFKAKITRMIPLIDNHTRTCRVEATPEDTDVTLLPGMTVEANIIIQKKDSALVLPKKYVLPGDSVIMDNGEKRKIITGLRNADYVEILQGLNTSDKVILK